LGREQKDENPAKSGRNGYILQVKPYFLQYNPKNPQNSPRVHKIFVRLVLDFARE
jgi:hypothetical protein